MTDASDGTARWWSTAISDIRPNHIALRGYPIEDLIGRTSYADMVWLMLRGDLPSTAEARLLDAALVAAVDHGPQAPSIAAARMAATCGVDVNGAVATGINLLGDVHGGAGQQCLEVLGELIEAPEPQEAADALVRAYRRERRHVPGFGHRFHQRDPRRDPLLELVRAAVDDGVVRGRHLQVAEAIEAALVARHGKAVPMNIDGCSAVIYGELGFDAAMARGLFVLSRAVGILAHVQEQRAEGIRIKGPLPRDVLPEYTGAAPRRSPPRSP